METNKPFSEMNLNELEKCATKLYLEDYGFYFLYGTIAYMLGLNYKFHPVKPTRFEKLSNQELFSMFNHNEITEMPKTKQLELYSEVNKRICKVLQIVPSVFKEMKSHNIKTNPSKTKTTDDDEDELTTLMSTEACSNIISVNFEDVKYNEADSILSTIFHETYHSYQFQQLNDILNKNKNIDTDVLMANFQNVVVLCINGFPKNRKKFTTVENNTDSQQKIPHKDIVLGNRLKNSYFYDLLEVEANLFAENQIKKLVDKNILIDYGIRSAMDVDSSYFMVKNLTNHNIQREKHMLKKHIQLLKLSAKKYDAFLYDYERDFFKSMFDKITPKSIDDFYDKKASQMRISKNMFYYEKDSFNLGEEYEKIPLNEEL